MISRVMSEDELSMLPKTGTEAQKIRALLLCYGTKYDFCRFFKSEGSILAEMNGSFVLSDFGECDYCEIAEFFSFGGFSEIFCSEHAGQRISAELQCSCKIVNLMRFCGKAIPADTKKNPPLENVFGILKTSFQIDFEQWYPDMSHRIRHNVSEIRQLKNTVLAVQYNLGGEVLLSQVATLPETRRRGDAFRLISAVCAEFSGNNIYVLCEDELLNFYQKVGFVHEGYNCIITRKNERIL